jgi:hypothetical protein
MGFHRHKVQNMVKDQRSGIICQYKIYVIEIGRLSSYHGHQMRQLIRQVLDTLQSHNIHRKIYLIFVDIMELRLVRIFNQMYSVFCDIFYLQPTSYLFQIPPIHLTMLPSKEKRGFFSPTRFTWKEKFMLKYLFFF